MQIDDWPVPNAAAGWITSDGRSDRVGDTARPFVLASITKPLVALAVLVAVEEGSVSLDDQIAVGNHHASLRHLLAHASGIGPESGDPIVEAGTRRIYSNAGFELIGQHLERATEMTTADYLRLAVAEPLGLQATALTGSPAHGATASVDDMLAVIAELMAPTLLHPSTVALAGSVQFPGLAGVLPGFGRQGDNTWGMGFEIRGVKAPHWTAPTNSERTFGHFGAAGTMFWIDPDAGIGCVALTDRRFGAWAADVWPTFSSQILSFG